MPRACRVYLVGEGTTDIGDLCYPEHLRGAGGKRKKAPVEGFYQPLLRKLAGEEYSLAFDGGQLKTFGRDLLEPRDALAKKARGALAVAATSDCEVLVLCTDTDRESGAKRSRKEAKRQRDEKLAAIEEGFSAAIEADAGLAQVHRLVAIPCRIVESWALADAEALREVTGGDVELPRKNAEDMWGEEEDATSDHPKCVLRRVLGEDPHATHYAAIAEAAAIERLASECPMSFAPFAAAVEELKEACGGEGDEG